VAARRCPQAVLCLDPFHVVKWATDALDMVRRETWNAARKGGETAAAKQLKDARFALWKNPADLTRRQRAKLARLAEVNRSLYRAYRLKEELRLVFRVKGSHGGRAAGRVAVVGQALPQPRVRGVGQDRRRATARDRRRVAARPVERAGGVGQHQAAGADPPGV
jgi:Transposase